MRQSDLSVDMQDAKKYPDRPHAPYISDQQAPRAFYKRTQGGSIAHDQ
jgi:hypothetical protein